MAKLGELLQLPVILHFLKGPLSYVCVLLYFLIPHLHVHYLVFWLNLLYYQIMQVAETLKWSSYAKFLANYDTVSISNIVCVGKYFWVKLTLWCLQQVIESKHKALEDTPCRNYAPIIICTSAGIINNWNLFIKRNEEPVKALATWFSGCNTSHVENMMFDIMRNDLYGEEWRKFKTYWLHRNKKVPISSQLIGLCSRFKISLPYKTYFESYQWDDDLAKIFWEKKKRLKSLVT